MSVIFLCAVLCNQVIIGTFYSVRGPRQCNSCTAAESSLYLRHGTVKTSAEQIRAAERGLSATGVVSCVRHRHRFVMALLCKALHFGIVIYGCGFGELIQMMIAIKWHLWNSYGILWKCYLSHPEHPYIADPCCTLLRKISTPVWLQMLFETTFFCCRLPCCFISRSCFQMACRSPPNEYSVGLASEPIPFPGVLISLCSRPWEFRCSRFLLLPGLLRLCRGTFSLRSHVWYCCSQDKEGVKVLYILLHEQSQHRLNYQRV